MEFQHVSVLLEETIEGLNIRPNGGLYEPDHRRCGTFLPDCKAAGALSRGGRLIAIDMTRTPSRQRPSGLRLIRLEE